MRSPTTAASREAPHPPECKHAPARVVPNPLVREMLRALGVVTCPDCHEVRAILGRRR